MASSHQDTRGDLGAVSLRSRASSVISTGTKISIGTLPQEELLQSNTEAGFAAGRNWRPLNNPGGRPHSLLSFTSHADQPAPPYEADGDGPYLSSYRYEYTPNNIIGHQRNNSLTVAIEGHHHDHDGPSISPPSDSENALSMHYSRVVRTIDGNQAQEIQRLTGEHERELTACRDEIQHLAEAHVKELAVMRHEIDQAYRKEWKAKNRDVEKIREEANTAVATLELEVERLITTREETVLRMQDETSEQIMRLEKEHEIAIVKARNAIEDLWETRWSDRTNIVKEEAHNAWLDKERELQKALARRDAEWINLFSSRYPDLLPLDSDLKDVINELGATTKYDLEP